MKGCKISSVDFEQLSRSVGRLVRWSAQRNKTGESNPIVYVINRYTAEADKTKERALQIILLLHMNSGICFFFWLSFFVVV